MFESYKKFWKNYVNFSGTSNRPDYWWPVLVDLIIGVIFGVLMLVSNVFSYVEYVYDVAILIPSLAITVRRLRDGGYSWANIFWAALPLIGWIILLVKLCKPSK